MGNLKEIDIIMQFEIEILDITQVEEIESYWTKEDYVNLLEKMDFPDAGSAKDENLRELLLMAITDFEPNEAAAIILEYKLSEHLNEGQIQQISNDMLLDKIAEEYPEIGLQATLFHINQLLFKAFNGKFPNTKGNLIDLVIKSSGKDPAPDWDKEKILKLLSFGLSDRNLIKRLFGDKLESADYFKEADDILWDLKIKDDGQMVILTSAYWIGNEDLVSQKFDGELKEEEEDN